MSEKTERYVVVTTDNKKRGVFGGLLVAFDSVAKKAILTDVRMAVYWSADVHGVVGLAANGPTKTCKISPAAPQIELDGVTAVMDMTPKALEAWNEEPWA